MAKKSFLLLALTMAMLSLSSVRVSAASTPIPLTGEYIDPHKGQLGGHRSQTIVPELEIDDYTLFFMTPCDGCVLRLLDEDGAVVYTTVIPSHTTSLVLPSYLSGAYEIQIIQGSIYYWGNIDL
jgi:hypothetical protein